MSITFRQAFYQLAPSWLTSGEGEGVLFSLMITLDAFMDRMDDATQVRYPDKAPGDALGPMGQDRRIVRGFAEGESSYRLRLRLWLDAWAKAGHAFAIMNQIAAYLTGFDVPMSIVTAGNGTDGMWYQRSADGTLTWAKAAPHNWDWDTETVGAGSPKWSRFWVILYPPASLWTPVKWGARKWGVANATMGSTATRQQVDTIKALVQAWKPERSKCMHVIVAFDPASFDPTSAPGAPMPDGTWKFYRKGDDPVVSSRNYTARYWKVAA